MKDNQAKYPQLRFKGFTDPWEQRKLGELGKIYTGNTPKTSDLDNWTDNKEGHIWITPTDIDKLIMSDSDRHLSEQGWSKARKIPENSVLITSIASIGKNTINAVPVAFNQQINAIVPEKNDSYFILSAMIKDTARFASVAGQTATAIINKTTFEKFQIATPSYEEQQKIGSFFTQLDNTITLHQRKLAKLKELKQGYLQKMFPKNGSKFPQLRFAGFADAWEQRNFGELYKKNLERNKDQFSSDRTISIATMRFKKEGNGAAEDSLVSYKVLREGDIAFEGHTSKRFAFGRFVLNDIGDGIMSPRFTTLRPTQDMPIKFWKQYIHYEPIMRYPIVNSTKLGTMMNELVVDEFLNQPVLVPELSEQQKIGTFFKQLDDTITLHQRKLEKLQELKKGYLQKMFC
ncbi:restriction endonuclease subunit S (plasmid) [Lentilactobacillus parabuchneri]|uniref:restriction endonuclease subunit S n=1 Tax=Lentilactobacillus parabuchneri TaxID=152331 RepID=UPI0018694A6A|nr:restriction endonuclease subunit S [Lentilactobacillus parabuchneri]QOP51789.1 restriction endonuclease subunit S [Lentilactobacillus parabuchneri]